VGFQSLTKTTHPPNFNLPSSGQQITARLSARKVSATGGNRAQDPLVRDTREDVTSFLMTSRKENDAGIPLSGEVASEAATDLTVRQNT
jgi:hypothetical protein